MFSLSKMEEGTIISVENVAKSNEIDVLTNEGKKSMVFIVKIY